jgi:hypothetical protein
MKMFEPVQQHQRCVSQDNPLKGTNFDITVKSLLPNSQMQQQYHQQPQPLTSSSGQQHPAPRSLESELESLLNMEPLPIGPGGYSVVTAVPRFRSTSFGPKEPEIAVNEDDSITQLLSSLSEERPAAVTAPVAPQHQQHAVAPLPIGQQLGPPMNTRPITPNNIMKVAPLPFTLKELEEDFQKTKSAISASSSNVVKPPKSNRASAASPSVMTAAASSAKPRRFRRDQADQWSTMFQALLEFKEQNGHCSVPRTSKKYPLLGRWVKRQRYQYKLMCDGNRKSTMTQERAQALADVGFVWDSYSSAWAQRYEDLKKFVQKYGHANVPSPFPENPQLSNWCKFQRREYKNLVENKGKSVPSQTHMDRILAMEELGFQWELRRSSKRSSSSRKMSL